MKYNKHQHLNMLNTIVKHFSKDPEKLRGLNNNKCQYIRNNNPGNIGCAIGMFCSDKVANKLDKTNYSIIDIFEKPSKKLLPKWMQKMNVDILQDFQTLHDSMHYWDNEGLTIQGKQEVLRIKKKINEM